MKKIPTVFVRDLSSQPAVVTPEVVPGCEWVLAGEGVATRKYDGMCCAVISGEPWKRREVKTGKIAPDGFVQTDEDEVTGKRFGWVPIGDGPEDKHFRNAHIPRLTDGTYELLGPKVQGNPEGLSEQMWLRHCNAVRLTDAPRGYDALKEYLAMHDIEGIVWHHPDGRMAKIKGKDFGIKRGCS